MIAPFARRGRRLLAWLLVLAAVPRAYAGKEFLAGAHEQVQPDQLLVRLKPGGIISQILSAIAPQAVSTALGSNSNVFLLELPPGVQTTVSKLLAAHPLVDYVEPNRIRTVTAGPPNDTFLTQQWNLTTVHAQQAWNYIPDFFLTSATAGLNRVKVAILDTGLDCTHPDFINAGGSSIDALQGGQIDVTDSTYIQQTTLSSPTCSGWADDYGHGTHVAGIVAAATNNATGVASLGFPLQLMIIKTSNNSGSATDFQVSEGIYDAINAGAQVISMSLGGAGYSQTMQNAMDAAWASNVLVIAAAGNLGTSELVYPGDGNHVMAVAATDDTNAAASFSSYGNWIKIAAPGVNILSTLPTYSNQLGAENYGKLEGTSMATPHVSALAGLLFAANPGISAAEVAQRIQQTAQSPNTGWDQHIGYGVINAAAALENIPGPFTEGAITGQVLNSGGFPVSGAVVTAGTQSYTTANDPTSGDTDGLFRLNLAPGTYTVTATDTGNTTVTTQATVVAGADTMLTIQFGISYGTFSGTVTYNGAGVAGATVAAVSNGQILGTAIANSSGNYTLLAPPGTYTLTASAPNYISSTSGSQTLAANGSVTANLALSALGNITGTITDLNGLPVPNANVAFTSAGFNGGAITASNGTYTTPGLPAGTYTVTASASGYTNVSVSNVNVANNTSTLVNLDFATGASLSTGLVAYWPFNDGSGSQALDQSGNNHTATLTNTNWTTGFLFPYALQFNVNESYATSNAIAFSGPFSVSVWVNSTASEIGWATLVYGSNYWSLGLDSTGTMYKFIVNVGTGSTGTCSVYNISKGCAQGGTVTTGWHLVTATYDGTNALLYVDNALVASDTFSVTLNATVLQMGTNWGGAMQSMRIYNRVLTAPEVSELYSQGSPAAINLSKTADAATVAAGNSIGFTLTAGNPGTGTAQVVTLNDPLPSGTGIAWSVSPAYSGPGSCGVAGGTLSCSFGSLSPGATASVHVTGTTTASSCGIYANTATASSTNASSVQASATTIVQCGQTITFGGIASQPFGTSPTVSATASSGLPVSFNSQTGSICTVSGSTVTLVAVGLCTIQATQAGNSVYTAASPLPQSFQVTQGSQTIDFPAIANKPLGTAPFAAAATASSGLTVSFTSQSSAVCTISNGTVTLAAIGACIIQAAQSGNGDYAAAQPVSQSFTVTAGIGSAGVNGLSFPNTVVGSSSGSETFSFQNTGNAPLTITSIAPTGSDAANYRYTADASHPCPISPATLAASASCTLDVTFAPASQGAHNNAQITITDNSGNVSGSTQSIGLSGTGIVLSSISVTANSASLSYGAGEPFTATGTYNDNSTATLTNQVTWASSNKSVASISASGAAAALSAGQTNITASLGGITSNSFQLTVVPGTPANIAAAAGSGQSITVGLAFASTLQALVKDGGADPVPNASVTFSAPATGASGTFANGLATYTVATNSAGIASAPFTANATAGAYSVTASVAGAAGTASFSLTNLKAPVLTIAEQANGVFVQGQSASYTVTVSNGANAGPTSGTITVTESAPAGLTLTGLSGGATWTCSVSNATCTTNTVLNPGASSSITVTLLVGYSAQGSPSNGVSVTGGTFQTSTYSASTVIISACAVTLDSAPSVADLQQIINEALGVSLPRNDLNGDGAVNIVDLQIVTNAALGGTCKAS